MRFRLVARGAGTSTRAELPPHLQEDIRLVSALAELFATIAAERLLDDDPAGNTSRPTLPAIALAAGAALCVPLLERQATRRPGRRTPHRDLVTRGARRGALSVVPPSTKGEGPHAYA